MISTDKFELNCLSSDYSGPVIIYISNEQFGNSAQVICEKIISLSVESFVMCELLVKDWDRYLTPWKADINMSGREFRGEAAELLKDIEEKALPKLKELAPNERIYLAGYSLAGLFALWTMYESAMFNGAACCSASLWYPGWKEYASAHTLKQPSDIYLSLGKAEKKARNPVMRTIEENMLLQLQLIKQDKNAMRSCMKWHEGGHFNETDERVAMGIGWLL